MTKQDHENGRPDVEFDSALADQVMGFVENREDQEVRSTRDKIEAFAEQINSIDNTIEELQIKIEEAIESLNTKKRRRDWLNRRCEIERDKLHQLEKLGREHAGADL